MAAADIATMRNALCDQLQRLGILANHPFDTKIPNLVSESLNGKLELSLLHGDER